MDSSDERQSKKRAREATKSRPNKACKLSSKAKTSGSAGGFRMLGPEDFGVDDDFFPAIEEIDGMDVAVEGGKVKLVPVAEKPNAKSPSTNSQETQTQKERGLKKRDKSVTSDVHDTRVRSHAGDVSTKNKGAEGKNAKKNKKSADVQAKEEDLLELQRQNAFAALESTGFQEEDADVSAWVPLQLDPRLLECLARLNFANPTAIQKAALPEIIQGHDLIGKSETGSGKTLAFAIPIVQHWLLATDHKKEKGPTALVLSPTRELAQQIARHFKELCAGLSDAPYVCSVVGGMSVQKQVRELRKAEIIVCTPGRMWDVLKSESRLLKSFKQIRFMVVDEADRIFSDGHYPEVEEITQALAPTKGGKQNGDSVWQTLVFSATLDKRLRQKLSRSGKVKFSEESGSLDYLLGRLHFQGQPKFVDVNPTTLLVKELRERILECEASSKDLYLSFFLMIQPQRRTLIFSNSLDTVDRLGRLLQTLNWPAYRFHSKMEQKERMKAKEAFERDPRNGRHPILVATDAAARGLHVSKVDIVLHYHVPRTAETYVHRSGRTARADNSGLSVLLCSPEERDLARTILAAAHSHTKHNSKKDGGQFHVPILYMDHKAVARLREAIDLAKQIVGHVRALEKVRQEDKMLHQAEDELGYDVREWKSDLTAQEKESAGLTKKEFCYLRGRLMQLLEERSLSSWQVDQLVELGQIRGLKGDE